MMDARYIQNQYHFHRNLDGRTYFKNLRDAVIAEYRELGYCGYIDEFFEGARGIGSIIEMAVISELYNFYRYGTLTNTDGEPFIPYYMSSNNRNIPWESWPQISISNVQGEVWNKLMSIRNEGRKEHKRYIEGMFSKFKGLGKADGDYNSADSLAKANEILAKAEEEAKKIKEQAHAEASRERNGIIDEARQRYTQLVSEAQAKAEKICAEAEQKKPAWDEEAAKERLGKHFEEYKKQVRAEQDDREKEFLKLEKDTAEKTDSIHREMCEMTNAVQAEWGRKINETIEDLRAIESDFFTKLHTWQTSLYPRGLERIADNYVELYRIINIDKILQAETVFQMSQESEKPSEATLEALEKLENKLRTHLKRYGNALNGLGMYVLFPQEGEAYDDAVHSCAEEPEEPAIITKCITPAIIRRMEGDGNEDVVKRAVVEVKATGKDAMSYEYYNV